MTVTEIFPTRKYDYDGPGDYPFDFRALDETNIVVYFIPAATGVREQLIYQTDYSVTLYTTGGLVHMLMAEEAGIIEIVREIPYTQDTEWVNNNEFDMALLESALDKTVMLLQHMKIMVEDAITPQRWSGTWIADRVYQLGDTVIVPGSHYYICIQSHTSTTFEDDLAAGRWEVFIDATYINLAVSAVDLSQAAQEAAELAASNAAISETNAATSADEAEAAQAACELILAQIAQLPVGLIVPWICGHFSDGSNGSFVPVLCSNTIAAANEYLNGFGWYVCDGAELDMGGGIFNGAGKYLPNLSDYRFIQGDATMGAIGGVTTSTHTHTGPSHQHTGPSHRHIGPSHNHSIAGTALSVAQIPLHNHFYSVTAINEPTGEHWVNVVYKNIKRPPAELYVSDTGSGQTHTHGGGYTGNAGTSYTSYDGTGATGYGGTGNTGSANSENRPKFLSCLYIMKVA